MEYIYGYILKRYYKSVKSLHSRLAARLIDAIVLRRSSLPERKTNEEADEWNAACINFDGHLAVFKWRNCLTRAQKEQQALEQFAAIVEEWEVESAQRISPHLPVMPDYYCGAYLDSAGELNVVLKENAPATASALLGQTKNNSVKTHAGTYDLYDSPRTTWRQRRDIIGSIYICFEHFLRHNLRKSFCGWGRIFRVNRLCDD